jgi:ribosomal-protein-alanine N-acetyltransferase
MITYIIITPRLQLRQWLPSDIPPFTTINKDATVMQYFPNTLTDEETLQMITRINTHFEEHGYGPYAVENKLTKEFLGYTGFAIPTFESYFTPCIEIGWRFKKEAWGQGFATEAAIACLRYGFETLGFDKVFSFTAVINTKSEKVMQRIGMTLVGYFDHPKIEKGSVLCRHVLYRITKEEFDAVRTYKTTG